ncbi:phosphatase [Egicoccus halophilus]|uniref:Phosphatase n=1 Tax=Egicoccus halophilus TaxID=1670830 RepID=A0A8J3ETN8_9ACTN|nr:phosphatase [Egicoccus halophilus]
MWDWNGTLLDDQLLVVEALNAVLADRGLPPTDLATYQRLYTRPVRTFYERLFGRPIGAEEWEHLDEVYHHGYASALERARLAIDAEVALDRVAALGRSQSLLSMYRHDQLVPLVRRLGIDDRFVRVDGLRGPGGGPKAPHLEAHLAVVLPATGAAPDEVLVIGDALDDAAAAAHVGAACVLYDGGSHPRAQLEAVGVPVVDTLTDALAVAGLDASAA